jgi:protein-S-isoprenylcysteine O-methyltransferase Ste14
MLPMDRGNIFRVWLPLLLGLWGLGFLFQSGTGPHDWVRYIGLALGLIGLGGVIVARFTLGRSFSVAPKATVLVTSGIYSRIRNPIYVSGFVFLVGLFLILRLRYLWVLLPVVVIMQAIRTHREALVLEEKFGDTYREYRKRTWL